MPTIVPAALFRRVFFAALVLTGFLAASLPAQSNTGAVEGRVFNAATGSALANARVLVEGTTRDAVTDADGTFRITGIPSGPAQVNVSYVGMLAQKATVNVPAGGAVQREFELSL